MGSDTYIEVVTLACGAHAKFDTLEFLPVCRAFKGFSGARDFAILSERVLIQDHGPGHYGTLGLH